MTEPVISVRDLTVEYPVPAEGLFRRRGVHRAVDGVSLDLRDGEILALVGESGSGKSTVARTVMGLIEPAAGSVELDGVTLPRIARRAAEQRRAVQMVFQDPGSSLDPRMSVGRIVAEGWGAHPLVAPAAGRVAGVAELLEQVGLDPMVAKRRPGALSGGQRQRVSIARALALRPRVLVCDEAVSALDVSVQSQILRLLLDLRDRDGIALLFITHDLAVVRQIADRVAVMRRGELVELAPADELFAAPAHEYTKALLDAALELEGAP